MQIVKLMINTTRDISRMQQIYSSRRLVQFCHIISKIIRNVFKRINCTSYRTITFTNLIARILKAHSHSQWMEA